MSYRLPSSATLEHAVKIAIQDDKPIMMDYWTDSLDKKVMIGLREGTNGEKGEKLLVRSDEEYTSNISKIYAVETDFIIATENSIYIVSKDIPKKRIA
jgi:hypothetical protein